MADNYFLAIAKDFFVYGIHSRGKKTTHQESLNETKMSMGERSGDIAGQDSVGQVEREDGETITMSGCALPCPNLSPGLRDMKANATGRRILSNYRCAVKVSL